MMTFQYTPPNDETIGSCYCYSVVAALAAQPSYQTHNAGTRTTLAHAHTSPSYTGSADATLGLSGPNAAVFFGRHGNKCRVSIGVSVRYTRIHHTATTERMVATSTILVIGTTRTLADITGTLTTQFPRWLELWLFLATTARR